MYKTIVVVDSEDFYLHDEHLECITFEQYLNDYPKRKEPKTRIINLCDTEHYLSRGYYCSLLAEARQHKVLPSVSTINDLRTLTIDHDENVILGAEVARMEVGEEPLQLLVFFGWVEQAAWQKLVRQIFEKYPAPILHLEISRQRDGLSLRVKRNAFALLDDRQREQFGARLALFTQLVWRNPSSKKRHRWEMAILLNPNEPTPPSDREAIARFVKAAAKVGINAETITSQQASQISQYDALFIRETTAIDHPTYQLARRAEREGLVVIDDSTSILRCCNKVFLHDAFTYNKVPSLRTRVAIGASARELDDIEAQFDYPVVLKMPESSFSKGVFKVDDRAALELKLQELLSDTALVLVQEFLYTDFDWRIGIINGRPIYACRYHMARNHWQIYNHASKRFAVGGYETLPTFEVPKLVLDAAMKATHLIGSGLYGVDIKQKGNHAYVIEVNDNPSIEHKVEDAYLGNELYMLIMSEFSRRLEKRGR